MNTTFHLAINVNDMEKSKRFYCEILGCELGDFEEGKWQDVNFWGNELTFINLNPLLLKKFIQ